MAGIVNRDATFLLTCFCVDGNQDAIASAEKYFVRRNSNAAIQDEDFSAASAWTQRRYSYFQISSPDLHSPICTGINSAATTADWVHYGGTQTSRRYSALDQINTSTVKNLAPAWVFQTRECFEGLHSTPIVVDGVCMWSRHVYAVWR